MRSPLTLSLTLALVAGFTEPAAATIRVVPDDDATIQAALDSGADTVLVRDGVYAERLLVSRENDDQHLRSHPDNSGTPRIAGLEILHRDHYSFFGLRFEGRIILRTNGDQEALGFERCTLDSGLTHSLGDFSDLSPFTVRHCVIRGDIVALPSIAVFESDTLLGAGLKMHLEGAGLRVEDCVFVGPGAAAVHAHSGTGTVIVRRNSIAGYTRGIFIDMEDVYGDGEIADNTITDCSEWAIVEGEAGGAAVLRNRISHCGGGIRVESENQAGPVAENDVRDCASGIHVRGEYLDIAIRANRVLRITGPGIVAEAFYGSTILVVGNVVGRCLIAGIVGSSGSQESSLIMRSNTSYANQGNGYGLNVYEDSTTPRLERNIAVENGGFGLLAADGIASLSCNDWYFNQNGATSGVSPDPDDYSVDPGFCDIDSDSVHLTALSSLLSAPGCGLIGALGQGCETTTEVRVVTLHAEHSAAGVELRWRGAATAAVAVERAPEASGPWAAIAAEPVLADGEWLALDREATRDRDHWYRLVGDDGAPVAGPILVAAAARLRAIGLGAIRPNPSSGPAQVEFTLDRAQPVRLSVHDVQGREVALLLHEFGAAGSRLVNWNGEGERGRLSAGLYYVRLRAGGQSWTRAWVVTR